MKKSNQNSKKPTRPLDKKPKYNLDLNAYSNKGPTLGDIQKLAKKDPSKLTTKEKRQLAEYNKLMQEAFASLKFDFSEIISFQKVISNNLSAFGNIAQSVFNAQQNLFAAFENAAKFSLKVKTIHESFSINLSTLQGHRKIDEQTSIDIAVNDVRSQKNKVAVGGSLVTYKEQGNFVLIKRSDFDLLIDTANSAKDIKESVARIEHLLTNDDNSNTVLVKAEFAKVEAQLKIFGKTIKLTGSSKQASLCEVLFNSNEPLTTQWHIDDLLETEEFGVKEITKDERPDWLEKAYQWARQLNLKIAAKTGKDDLILVRDQKIYINPKYLN